MVQLADGIMDDIIMYGPVSRWHIMDDIMDGPVSRWHIELERSRCPTCAMQDTVIPEAVLDENSSPPAWNPHDALHHTRACMGPNSKLAPTPGAAPQMDPRSGSTCLATVENSSTHNEQFQPTLNFTPSGHLKHLESWTLGSTTVQKA